MDLGGLPDPLHLSLAWKPQRLVRSRYSSCHAHATRASVVESKDVQAGACGGAWVAAVHSGARAHLLLVLLLNLIAHLGEHHLLLLELLRKDDVELGLVLRRLPSAVQTRDQLMVDGWVPCSKAVTHGRSANGAGGSTVCGGKQRRCGYKSFQHIAARTSTRCELVRCRRVEAGREHAEESRATHFGDLKLPSVSVGLEQRRDS